MQLQDFQGTSRMETPFTRPGCWKADATFEVSLDGHGWVELSPALVAGKRMQHGFAGTGTVVGTFTRPGCWKADATPIP